MNRIFRNRKGFSLIEILIALTVSAFILVTILGMFPVAIEAASDSTAETRITAIAQSIMADIHRGTNHYIISGPDAFNDLIEVNIEETNTYYIAYTESGEAITEIDGSTFSNGFRNGAWFLSKIDIVPDNNSDTKLTQISAYIHSPAQLSVDRPLRKSYSFVHYINVK